MTSECKKILLDTIDMFEGVPIDERESKVNFIKRQLSQSNSPNCFFDPAQHYVDAAKIFLRIAHKIPFVNKTIYSKN